MAWSGWWWSSQCLFTRKERKHVPARSDTRVRSAPRACQAGSRATSAGPSLLPLDRLLPQPSAMFQTASRRLAATAMRRAESINIAHIEASYKVGLSVSRAQGEGQRGLLDGIPQQSSIGTPRLISKRSHWQNPSHPSQAPLRRDRLQRSRQGRIPEPRWLRQRPCRPLCR